MSNEITEVQTSPGGWERATVIVRGGKYLARLIGNSAWLVAHPDKIRRRRLETKS